MPAGVSSELTPPEPTRVEGPITEMMVTEEVVPVEVTVAEIKPEAAPPPPRRVAKTEVERIRVVNR
jgi:hypothetical protein